MKRFITAALVAAALLLSAPGVQAQTTFGVHGAYELEGEDFGLGGQLRTAFNAGSARLVFNPNAEYYFEDNVTLVRGGLDVLYEIGDSYTTTFTPYVGAGLGIQYFDIRSDFIDTDASTDFGLNLIGGARFGFGGVSPFMQAGITIIEHADPVTLKFGILFGGQ